MAYSITLAGQDITLYTDQLSIEVDDTLGQGGGAGASGATQGRAATVKMKTTLGPMSKAVGAGTDLSQAGTTTTQVITTILSDTFTRANQAGWGTSSDGHAWTFFGAAPTAASIVSNAGVVSGGGASTRNQLGTTTYSGNRDLYCTFTPQNSGDLGGPMALLQTVGNNNYYRLWVNSGQLLFQVVTAGTPTTLASTAFSITVGQAYKFHLNISGNTFSGNVWLASGTEPVGYMVSATDMTYGAGYVGVACKPGTSSSTPSFTDFHMTTTATVIVPGGFPNPPALVRQGEIIIKDASNTVIFGGYVTKYTDTTTSILGQTKQTFTDLEGIDYSTSLQRTMVNESFSAQTDIQIIKFVMQKYAPWVKLDYLPKTPTYLFPIKNFRNTSVEQVLQTVAGVVGYLVYVDYLKFLHYLPPTTATTAPFNLSDNPDFSTTFPHGVVEFLTDDNSAINRVRFFGGTKLSNDIFQDVSPLANASNKIFMLAYFATQQSDGKYHVKLNGVEQVVGFANATGAANTLISAGGTAQCIIDPGSRTVTFDVAPAGGATVLIGYRYSFPMTLVLTDENSHKFFGDPYLDGAIDDTTVQDLATALQRCKVLLAQQSFGLTTLKIDVWKAGIQAGMVTHVVNNLRGINGTYLVQQVQISPLGGGNFVYHLTLGAWNWNLIDFLLKIPTLATFQDDQQTTDEIVVVESILTNLRVHDAWSQKTTVGPYYARATPVGDGHDSFPGFATISS